jgi:hypothetical protein
MHECLGSVVESPRRVEFKIEPVTPRDKSQKSHKSQKSRGLMLNSQSYYKKSSDKVHLQADNFPSLRPLTMRGSPVRPIRDSLSPDGVPSENLSDAGEIIQIKRINGQFVQKTNLDQENNYAANFGKRTEEVNHRKKSQDLERKVTEVKQKLFNNDFIRMPPGANLRDSTMSVDSNKKEMQNLRPKSLTHKFNPIHHETKLSDRQVYEMRKQNALDGQNFNLQQIEYNKKRKSLERDSAKSLEQKIADLNSKQMAIKRELDLLKRKKANQDMKIALWELEK